MFLFCCLASFAFLRKNGFFFWKIIQARLDSGDFIFSLSYLWWIDSYHTAFVFNSDVCIIFLLKNQVIKMSSAYLGFDWGIDVHGKEIHSANSWVPPVYQHRSPCGNSGTNKYLPFVVLNFLQGTFGISLMQWTPGLNMWV